MPTELGCEDDFHSSHEKLEVQSFSRKLSVTVEILTICYMWYLYSVSALGVQDHLLLHSVFEASLGYINPVFKNKQTDNIY